MRKEIDKLVELAKEYADYAVNKCGLKVYSAMFVMDKCVWVQQYIKGDFFIGFTYGNIEIYLGSNRIEIPFYADQESLKAIYDEAYKYLHEELLQENKEILTDKEVTAIKEQKQKLEIKIEVLKELIAELEGEGNGK